MVTKLTPHFTLNELTVTKTGLANIPTAGDIDNLRKLCRDVLEPIREKIGYPIIVTSGYRSAVVNRAVGGVGTSQHLKGESADIHCNYQSASFLYDTINLLVSEGLIHVGQCILYRKSHFVHVSLCTSHHKDEFIVKHKN